MKQHIARRELTIPLYRIEKSTTPSGGTTHTRVADGTRTGTVELRIDVDRLMAQLGDKALRAKTGRTRLASGMIEVIVVRA